VLDGGFGPWLPWFTQPSNTGSYGFFLPFNGPMVIETAAIDNAGNVSDWSADSLVCGGDFTAPTAPASLTAMQNGSGVTLQWPPGTDVWTGVGDYELEVSVDAGAFARAGSSDAGTFSAPLSPGAYVFRVRSVDLAGNESPWTLSNLLTVPADAGPAFVDAGVRGDGGEPSEASSLDVHCGCTAAAQAPIFALLWGLARRRRTTSGPAS
jgi:hypothetical protein